MWPFDAVNWLLLAVPIAYMTVLFGSLFVFSNLYRKRKAASAASLAPWFPPHLQRNIYLTLLEKEDPKVPDSILKAALLRRATEGIHRIVQVRNAKQALQVLLQRGSVGDDLWQRFLRAEQETEEELRDIINEANAFVPGWGQIIFQSASEMAQNAHMRERLSEILATAPAEKEWWETRKATIQTEFMKELEEEKKATMSSAASAASETSGVDDAVLVEGGGPAEKSAKGKKKGKK